jgi:hypothetical protein
VRKIGLKLHCPAFGLRFAPEGTQNYHPAGRGFFAQQPSGKSLSILLEQPQAVFRLPRLQVAASQLE